jgi:hypothetical protein
MGDMKYKTLEKTHYNKIYPCAYLSTRHKNMWDTRCR